MESDRFYSEQIYLFRWHFTGMTLKLTNQIPDLCWGLLLTSCPFYFCAVDYFPNKFCFFSILNINIFQPLLQCQCVQILLIPHITSKVPAEPFSSILASLMNFYSLDHETFPFRADIWTITVTSAKWIKAHEFYMSFAVICFHWSP